MNQFLYNLGSRLKNICTLEGDSPDTSRNKVTLTVITSFSFLESV